MFFKKCLIIHPYHGISFRKVLWFAFVGVYVSCCQAQLLPFLSQRLGDGAVAVGLTPSGNIFLGIRNGDGKYLDDGSRKISERCAWCTIRMYYIYIAVIYIIYIYFYVCVCLLYVFTSHLGCRWYLGLKDAIYVGSTHSECLLVL